MHRVTLVLKKIPSGCGDHQNEAKCDHKLSLTKKSDSYGDSSRNKLWEDSFMNPQSEQMGTFAPIICFFLIHILNVDVK